MNNVTHYQKFFGGLGIYSIKPSDVKLTFEPRNRNRVCAKLIVELGDRMIKRDHLVIKKAQISKVISMVFGIVRGTFRLTTVQTEKRYQHIKGSQGRKRKDKRRNYNYSNRSSFFDSREW